jgi:hypothetical protein
MGKKKNGTADVGPGHNSQLTDDEKRALTFHHAKLYAAADSLVEKAKADRTAVMDLAASDLGKGAKADIKDILLVDTPKKMKAVVERTLRLARWAGLPVGTQQNLFEPATNHTEDGKRAGMEGSACEPPKSLAVDASQKWIAGWHEGQTILASAFKKKRPVDGSAAAPDPAQIDLSERKDLDGGALAKAQEDLAKYKAAHP